MLSNGAAPVRPDSENLPVSFRHRMHICAHISRRLSIRQYLTPATWPETHPNSFAFHKRSGCRSLLLTLKSHTIAPMYVQPTTRTLNVSFVHYTVEARHQQRRRRNLAFLRWHYTDVFIIHHSTTIPHAYPHMYSSTHKRASAYQNHGCAYSHRPRSPRRSALCKASIPVVCSNANVLDVLRVMMIVGGIVCVCVVPASSLTTSPSLPPAPPYLPCPYALTVGREMVSPARSSHTIILSAHTQPPHRHRPHRRQTQAYKRTHAL